VDTRRRVLTDFNTFYDGYDPEYSSWRFYGDPLRSN
jgi:hypothetical protein